jgi:hypothetical protein
VKKATTVILNQLNIKKIKSTDNFKKNHNKKKTIWKNNVAIHGILKKNTKLNF